MNPTLAMLTGPRSRRATMRRRSRLLFYRHAPAISRYVRRRLGASAAEDVVSNTFLTAFALCDRYDAERGDPRPP